MHALIDADWYAYSFGNMTNDEYKPLSWPFIKSRIDGHITRILDATEAESYQLYLTANDDTNFRIELATIKPYKGNRPTDKPYYYDRIRDYLVETKGAIVISGMEADDAVSIEQLKNITCISETKEVDWECNITITEFKGTTILCSIDKDLDNVVGHHFNWMKEDLGVYWISQIDGLRNFYKQLLTGDSVDNILGLFGVGKSSVHLKKLDECETELSMYLLVKEQYDKRFGSYTDQFLLENARLLHMLRFKDDEWTPPIGEVKNED